jgi:hypothetical protein
MTWLLVIVPVLLIAVGAWWLGARDEARPNKWEGEWEDGALGMQDRYVWKGDFLDGEPFLHMEVRRTPQA